MSQKKLHPQTLAIRGSQTQTQFKEHHQALFLTSSFVFDDAQECADVFAKRKAGYTYSRTVNPTVTAFQERIALLEGAESAIATSTGMSAIQATLLTFLQAGDHLLTSKSLFGTTAGLIGYLPRFGIEVSFVSQTDVNEWKQAMRPNTKMLFVETPSNPLNELADIEALAQIAHAQQALLVVDNCFCSPAVQQPLRWGADLSVQSATKAIDGQGRVLGGVVCGSKELIQQVATYVNLMGLSLSPFNAWILLSGAETLALRLQQQSANALKLAQWLQQQKQVQRVYYCGLPQHPQKDLVAKQQANGGIVVAFEVKGGQEEAWKVIDSVKIFSKTANLGDVRSTIAHPWTTTHARMTDDERLSAGIQKSLLRLSVGLEHVDDLIEDLKQAFAQI